MARLIIQWLNTVVTDTMSTKKDEIIRTTGISKALFIVSLVIVAAASGVAGYFAPGLLKQSFRSIISPSEVELASLISALRLWTLVRLTHHLREDR